jgi:hypothetical protein
MKQLLLFLVPVLLLAACKKPDDVLCYSEPASNSVRFRLLDAVSGRDLLTASQPNPLNRDSLKASQPCYPIPLVPRFTYYQIPGSGDFGYTFNFTNLPNPGPNAADDCFTIFLKWNQQDTDTVQWHYHIETIENCDLQILDYMQFNGMPAQKFNDGAFEYYALRK